MMPIDRFLMPWSPRKVRRKPTAEKPVLLCLTQVSQSYLTTDPAPSLTSSPINYAGPAELTLTVATLFQAPSWGCWRAKLLKRRVGEP